MVRILFGNKKQMPIWYLLFILPEMDKPEQSHERSERWAIIQVMNILVNCERWRLMRGRKNHCKEFAWWEYFSEIKNRCLFGICYLFSRRWIRTTVKRARIFRPATRRSGIIFIFVSVERVTGLEPAIFCLGSRHSTTELHPHAIRVLFYDITKKNISNLLLKFPWRDNTLSLRIVA